MLQKIDLPYRLENSPIPCLELMPEIGVLMFKIEGKYPKKMATIKNKKQFKHEKKQQS